MGMPYSAVSLEEMRIKDQGSTGNNSAYDCVT